MPDKGHFEAGLNCKADKGEINPLNTSLYYEKLVYLGEF